MAQKNSIKIANPNLSSNPTTYTKSTTTAWSSSILTASTQWFIWSDYYILIEKYWNEPSEISLVASSTSSSFTLSSVSVFDHSESTLVSKLDYNQIKIYWRTESWGADNPITTIDIDPTQQYTNYDYTWTTYSYFVFSYYNEESTDESDTSDEISAVTFTKFSAKNIIESWVRKALTRVDENPNSLLTWDALLNILDEWINEIITEKKNFSFLNVIDTTKSIVASQEYIEKPSNLAAMQFLKINNKQINFVSPLRFEQLKDDNVTTQTWEPYYYTLKNDYVYLYPTPSGAETATYQYYKYPDTISSLTSTVPKPMATSLVYYVAAQAAWARNNEKRWDKMYAIFEDKVKSLIEDYTWPIQYGEWEIIEQTSIYWEDNL